MRGIFQFLLVGWAISIVTSVVTDLNGWKFDCDRVLQFPCGKGICIEAWRRCDGHRDCPSGRDELQCNNRNSCSEFQFRCTSGQCVPLTSRCNGINDCKDGSDENECMLQMDTTCHEDEFRCTDGLRCIPFAYVCNGGNECWDGSDEENCHENGGVCKNNEFKCLGGECIDKSNVCNGKKDCRDGSDENNCGGASNKTSLVQSDVQELIVPPNGKSHANPRFMPVLWDRNPWSFHRQKNTMDSKHHPIFSRFSQLLDTLERAVCSIGILSEIIHSHLVHGPYHSRHYPNRYHYSSQNPFLVSYVKGRKQTTIKSTSTPSMSDRRL